MGADISLDDITPEDFAGLVKGASDEDLAAMVRAAGTGDVLARIFSGMQERFVPDRAQGVDATIGFVISDDGAEHPWTVRIAGGACEVSPGAPADAKVTISTDLVSFARLVAGQAQGPQLFMAGKLRVAGDLMFATRVMGFFDTPTA